MNIEEMTAELESLKGAVDGLKSHTAEQVEIAKQWKGHVDTKKKELSQADDDGKAAAQAALDEAVAGEAAAKEAVKASKQAVKENTEAAKELRKAIAEARKQEKAQAKADREAAKEQRAEQNGVVLPTPGTKNAQAFDLCDELAEILGRVPKMAEVLPLAASRGLTVGNVRGKYNKWRKFHGHPTQGNATNVDLATLAGKFPDVPEYTDAIEAAAAEEQSLAEKAQAKAEREAKKAEREAEKARKAEEKAAKAAAKEAATAEAE